MVNLLIGIIFILLCVIYMQYRMRKNSSENLRYTYEKLESIVNDKTGETLLVMTDDLELQKLLVAINQLLDAKQKTNADRCKSRNFDEKNAFKYFA